MLTAADAAAQLQLLLTDLPTVEPVAVGVPWLNNGVLTVSTGLPPTIDTQPQSTSVEPGSTATFTVVATNATSYQWQLDSGTGFANIIGATATSYTTPTLTLDDSGNQYRVVVTGAGGSANSTAATVTVSAFDALLSDYTTSVGAAYSLRKLRESYAGSAIRVRRSSDDAELDIGFVGETLDTAALLTFAGAGSAFVTTMYDQRDGTQRNATQSTAGSQPRIVNSGTLDQFLTRPAMVFDGTDDHFVVPDLSLLRNVPGMMASVVANISSLTAIAKYLFHAATPSSPSARFTIAIDSSKWSLGARRLDANSFAVATGTGIATATNYHHVGVVDFAITAGRLWINSALTAERTDFLTTGSTSDTDSQFIRIGCRSDNDADSFFHGSMSEIVIGDVAPSDAQRQALADNTELYYFGETL